MGQARIFIVPLIGFLLSTPPAMGDVIHNGDFSSGFNDWTLTRFPDGSVSDFGSIETQNGDPYARFSTGLFATSYLSLTLSQDFVVLAGSETLVADIKVFPSELDPTGNGNANLTDALFMNINSASNNVFFVDAPGGQQRQILGPLGVRFDPATDPFFDFQIVADLSSLVGQSVSLRIAIQPTDDGRTNQFGIDNIAIVPEPGSAAIIAALLGVAGIVRRRR